MKDKTLHMIGHAHIDPVWLWQWQEGFHEVKASFRSALDRMKEYPEFVFIASSAAFYEWVEKSDPVMFAEIQQRVSEGRWSLVGGWWIEPDCNIPSGESFVRQGLYGQRYFKDKFGITAKVGFNPDSFGHHGTLPQILKKSGLPYYAFMRPMPHEKHLPGRLFWWEADDGTRMLTLRIPFEYLTWGGDVEKHLLRCAHEMKAPLDEMVCFYGVGNHGGGPTVENLESIARYSADPTYPALKMSSLEGFFKAVEAKNLPLPIAHTDLQHHASGCYAAHSGVKQWNRRAENLLVTAEKWSALAFWATQQPYPTDFAQAWKGVLFNQFHDIMAGTSLESAYDDARDLYGEAMAIGGRGLNYAVQSFAWNLCIPSEAGMKPIVVFNPHAWPVKTNVELEFNRIPATACLLDDEGLPVPIQNVQSTTTAGRGRLSFIADLPALGYRVYRYHATSPIPLGNGFGAEGDPFAVQATDTMMENDRLRLTFDPITGTISSLFDKKAQLEVFWGAAAKPEVLDDPSDTWSHNVYKFDKVVGAFTASSVKLVEHGPVKSVIRVVSEYGASKLIQDFAMHRDLETIEVGVTVDWHEQFKMLKLRFPVNVHFMNVTREIPYGHMDGFANGEEEPMQSWVDVSGSSRDNESLYGLSVLNDAKYSLDVFVRDIGLTVLRSPIYAHHIPAEPQPDRLYTFQDQGIQRFKYALLPHTHGWQEAQTVQRAAELNQPPIALLATFHDDGTLPSKDSFIHVEPAHVIVSALKKAEDDDSLILRAYETTKTTTHATIHLPRWGRTISSQFAPCEIKTFRIPHDPTEPIVETNLLEWLE